MNDLAQDDNEIDGDDFEPLIGDAKKELKLTISRDLEADQLQVSNDRMNFIDGPGLDFKSTDINLDTTFAI